MKKGYLVMAIAWLLMGCHSDKADTSVQRFNKTLAGAPSVSYDFTRNITHEIILLSDHQVQERMSWLYHDGRYLHGYDWDRQNILRYDSNWSLVARLGSHGAGPDEIEDVYGFYYIDTDSTYLVFDIAKQRLARFGFNNRLLDYLKFSTQHMPFVDYLGRATDKNRFFIFHESGTGYSLSVLDFAAKRIVHTYDIKDIIPELGPKSDYDMVIEGQFHKNNDYTVYHFYKAGCFLVFSASGKPRLYRTIDRTPFPESVEIALEDGTFRITTNPPYVLFKGATVSEKHLYILSSLQTGNKKAIDIYDLATGAYTGSIDVQNLPDGQRPEEIAVSPTDTYMFIKYEDLTLAKYRLVKKRP